MPTGGYNIIAGLMLNTASFNASLRGAYLMLNKFTSSSKGSIGGMAAAFSAATLAVVGLVRGLVNMVRIIMEFSKATSELKGVLGETTAGMAELSEQAQDLGASTVHTATEVIKLQTVLARLGFDKNQILDMTESILHLGTAMGVSLPDAASLVGSVLRSFNLEAEEATRVSNILTKVTTESALSFDKLKVSLPYASTAADQYGISVERLSAMLGVLADRGLRASTIGTSMRMIFTKLAQKGLTYEQAMGRIAKSTDKVSTAVELFGVRAAPAAIILSRNKKEVDLLDTSLNDLDDDARKLAATMADNLSGDLTLAKSAWQSFVLAVDEGDGVLTESLRYVTTSITDMFKLFKDRVDGLSYYESLANRILETKEAQEELNDALELLKINFTPETAQAEIDRLLEKNKIEEDAIRAEKEKLKENKRLKIGGNKVLKEQIALGYKAIAVNDARIETLRGIILDDLLLVDTTGELTEEEKEALRIAEEAERVRKEQAITLRTLNKELALSALANDRNAQGLLRAKIKYEETVEKIKGLNLSLEEEIRLLGLAKIARENAEIPFRHEEKTPHKIIEGSENPFKDIKPNTVKIINDSLKEQREIISGLSDAYNVLGQAIAGALGEDDEKGQWWINYSTMVVTSVGKVMVAMKAMQAAKKAQALKEIAINQAVTAGNMTEAAGNAAKDASSIPFGWIAIPAIIAAVIAMFAPLMNMPKFAAGGIVGGTSFSGDQVVAGLNSKEMVLTQAQQANLFAMANGAGGGAGGTVEFEIRADKLIGVLNNYNRKMSKIR